MPACLPAATIVLNRCLFLADRQRHKQQRHAFVHYLSVKLEDENEDEEPLK